MIGKIKKLNFPSLIYLISLFTLIAALISKEIYVILTFYIGFLSSIFAGIFGIKFIKKLNLLQKIREDVPSIHKKKENTPTMGGILFIPIFLIIILFVDHQLWTTKIILFLTTLSYFFIGYIDDFLSIKNKTNLGLKSKEKFILQTIVTLLLLSFAAQNNLISSNIRLFNNITIDFHEIIFPVAFLTIIGLSNAVNLSDGLDGLVAGCSSLAFFGLGTEILLANNEEFFSFCILCYSMSGLCLGFLKFNKYPAKIFMGDTGSLSIGAILGVICVLTGSYFTGFLVCGIFIIETLSVMIQVLFFKITKKLFGKGKRLLLMSPIHHHFELAGFSEKTIVDYFWKINVFLVILGIVLKISF
tara:strand:- start:10 stop:1083 length:1074 start_codon:yes stop_codon:yes gene_type:complete